MGEAALKVDSLMTSQLLLSCEHKYFSLKITVLYKKFGDAVGKLCFHYRTYHSKGVREIEVCVALM